MGKAAWMLLFMTLFFQVLVVCSTISTVANNTDSIALADQGSAKSSSAVLKSPRTFEFASGRINSSFISQKKTENDGKSAKIVPDRPKLQKSSNYTNAVHILKHGTAKNVPEPKRESQAPERSSVESQDDDEFWKELLGSPLAEILAKSQKNQTILQSFDINHSKSSGNQRQYLLKRSKRDLSDDHDHYLHRSKRFMIPIGISKSKSNFLDNFRKRVNAIQSNRQKLKQTGSRGMKLSFPFLGSNQNAFSNLRNSLKRIGDKIGKDINWETPMLGDDPNALNKRVTCAGVQCHPQAMCYRSKCRCRKGLTGDGINTCQKMCKCTVSGDPHFHTFDGEILHLMGDCKYALSESMKFNDSCNFRVDVQNERRGSNKRVSWPKFVEIHIHGQSIRLGPNENVFVNGEIKQLPFMRLGGKIEVFQVSRSIQVTTKCGIQLSFNGKTIAQLLVPGKYASRLTGLCGDCNGKKDDLRTKEGNDVSKDSNKYSKIGKSYIVNDGSQAPGTECNTQDLEAKCSKEMEARYISSDYCGIINDPHSVFGDCVEADRDMANQYFESCMFDVCANQGDNDTALCDNIEVFALQCRDMGFPADWRDDDFCPIKCGENMHYDSEVSGCPASCMQQEAPSTCTLPSNEGCACNDGMVLNGKTCTYMSDCGCFDENGDYTPLGEEKMTENCSRVLKCTKKSDHPELVVYKELKCHVNAQCSIKDGQRMCKCNAGYVGDGYSSCNLEKKTKEHSNPLDRPQGDASYTSHKTENRIKCGQYTCHPKAGCLKDRCVCKPGLHGDGIRMCNDVCVCSAKGDPHYRTYDGEMITFMGPCRYLLTATTPKATHCQFRVLVTNEKRGGIGKVSWTKLVDVYIYDLHIRIDSSRKVYVNGEVRYLPSSELDGKIRLFRTGNHAIVSTECGLQVGFDGIHIVKVVAPSVLSQMMTGICGDCDGLKNDRRLKNGSDVSKVPGADTLVADSYREPMGPDKSNQDCSAHPVNADCVDDYAITNYCGIILNRTGPFAKCIEALPDIAKEYYHACRIDVCSYQQNVFMIDEVACDGVTSMADACEENGILVNWRSSEFCPIICPSANTAYSYRMSGCPATCVDPDAPKTCTQPDIEGCHCAPGFLLSDDVCVEPSKCGCKDPKGNYIPVGTKKISSDCRHTINCEKINGKVRLTTTKNKECGSHASCVLETAGIYHCKCNPGYLGDPHVKCSKGPDDIMVGDSPKNCDNCHPMAVCLDGRCVCKPGFFGDGITLCEDKCFCMVSGDPLYITFDGQLINYQGSCSYLLSKTTVPGDACEFQIHIKNKLRADGPRTVIPEHVHLEIYGHSYYIFKNETYVDDQLKYPPSIYLDGKVQLFHSGSSNGVSTKCGIQVFFSDHTVKVVIPRSYSKKITGLCGDCNHVHDDFRLSNGTNVGKNPRKHNLVGDSYLALKDIDDEKCRGPEPILCSKLSESAAKSSDKCGLMEDAKGPFKQCISNAPDLANQFFNACWQDLCLHGTSQNIVCQKLSAFADTCATLGFPAEWRNEGFCPTHCPKGMKYNSWSPGCQPSCAEPNPKSCDRFNSEGCSCMTGYVISGQSCVTPDQCGCFHSKTGDYVPLGSNFVSIDCEKFECKMQNGKASLVNEGKIKCTENARCTVFANQTFGCVCQEGYTGNGLTHCKVSTVSRFTRMHMLADQPNICPKCHPRASCKYNQCVCHSGFYGDGVNSCEKQCVCRATGDPHYATYDGAWFHYMGVCRYLMTQRLESGRCDFRITAKNAYRDGLNGTRILWIELEMSGNSYRIEKPKDKDLPILLLNNVAKEIGQSFDGHHITASRYGRRSIILKTSCNMSVSFDGDTAAISVGHSSGLTLRGMCGDCDGNKENDLPTEGSLMSRDHIVYGDTWRIPDPSDKPGKTCDGPSPVMCTSEQEKLARLDKNCGQLLDTTGPFKECISSLKDIMNEQFLNCKMEFCIVGASRRAVTCPKLEVAASICAAHGFVVLWRTDSFCPAMCSKNQQYNPFSSGCQPTCANPKAEESCTLSSTENCVCDTGFLLNEKTNECVNNCPLDLNKPPADSPGELTSKKKCGWYACAENADCKKVNGKQKCICRDGFAGNGIDVCDEAHCACSASGDPHYITFDSTSLYLLGDCKYTMARSVAGAKCAFKVEVKNEHRLYSRFPTRAFTRLVDVKIDGHVYQLHLYKHLYVDGKKHPMPYKNPSGTVTVKMEGKFMKLVSQCDLKVRFDGVHAVVITLPDIYAGKVEGICGNCDGNPKNDLMLSGRDLSHTANKTMAYEEFARQYLLVDDSDQPATDPICRMKS